MFVHTHTHIHRISCVESVRCIRICIPHSLSVVCGKMVRKQSKSKGAQKVSRITRSKSIALENNRKKSFDTIGRAKIQSKENSAAKNLQEKSATRLTRSKSVYSEKVEFVENTLAKFSPKRTRSKSEKNLNIQLISEFNHREKSEQQKKQSQNLKISAARYIKQCDFSVNSIVLAKQKYSCPWPAKVVKIEREKVFVYFFGDKRSGYVKKSEIYNFILSVNAVIQTLASKKQQTTYSTGIREIEVLMGIDQENSVFNEI